MSRFANPDARAKLVLGPCECPGTPHDEDWMELRSEISADEALAIAAGDNELDGIALLLTGWNLLLDDGTPAPPDRAHLGRLFGNAFDSYKAWLDEHVRFSSLPNRSAARSPITSVASGSRRTPNRKKGA